MRLTIVRHPKGLRHHSSTPQGAAVVVVPSSDSYHDGGLAADSPYSTTNQINQPPDLSISFYNRCNYHARKNRQEIGSFKNITAAVVANSPPTAHHDGGSWGRMMVEINVGWLRLAVTVVVGAA
nr:hypothetical protein [Tanacetum cinerariifolium]